MFRRATRVAPVLAVAAALAVGFGLSANTAPGASAQTCCAPVPSNLNFTLPGATVSTPPVTASVSVNGTQPVMPVDTTTTATVPVDTTAPVPAMTAPIVSGVPYVSPGPDEWQSPGGFYCNENGGGAVWVNNGADPAAYGC
jgi:hypothetical protein